MDIHVSTLSHWNEASAPDEKVRMARDRWLVPVKVYHESYPVSGDDAPRVKAFLATIPGRGTNSACKSGICRLDDLRVGRAKANGDPATK